MIGATCCPFHKVTALYQALSIINKLVFSLMFERGSLI